MDFDLRKLNRLKLKLMQEKELHVVMTYFFDHFGENRAFLDIGQSTRHNLLESIIAQTIGALLGAKTKVILLNLMLFHIPQHQFYHGAFIINGKMANVIYYDDIKMGCIAVVMSTSGMTNFVRFSAQNLPHKPATPSLN
jgi:hypothetical protein